jgi:hypothetical protein
LIFTTKKIEIHLNEICYSNTKTHLSVPSLAREGKKNLDFSGLPCWKNPSGPVLNENYFMGRVLAQKAKSS